MFNKYPYTDFHELNTDWIIGKIKNVEDAETNTKQYSEDAEAAKDAAVSARDDAVQAKDDAVSAKDTAVQAKDDAVQAKTDAQASAVQAGEIVDDTLQQIAVLQARVDNIIPDGTQTQGNTELLDIRVGADGTIYPSAGDAVRDQITALKTPIDDLLDAVVDINDGLTLIEKGQYTVQPEQIVGGVNPSDGTINPASTNYVRTPYMLIPNGADGIITNYKASSSYFGYAFYDKDKVFISGGRNTGAQDTAGVYSLVYDIPANAVYFIVCNSILQHADLTDLMITFTAEIGKLSLTSNKSIAEAIARSPKDFYNGVVTVYPAFLNGNVPVDGDLHNASIHYIRTDYIRIPDGCTRIETSLRASASSLFGYCLFDANKNFMTSGTLLGNPVTVIENLPAGAAYIMACDSSMVNSGQYIKFYIESAAAPAKNYNRLIAANNDTADLQFAIIQGKVLDANFDIVDMNAYAVTDYIDVRGLDRITVTNTVTGSCRYVFYDRAGNKIVTASTGANLIVDITVPYGAYKFVIACSNAQSATLTLKGHGNPYAGKNVSIIGDSISTYAGTLPLGYVTYYPIGDIQDLKQTWFSQVISELDMNLLSNASWSGSSVCGQTSDPTGKIATSDKRIADLASNGTDPDIIFVYIGTNDWNAANRVLGDFTSTSEIPGDGNILKISNAYAKMLYKVRNAYPDARIICLTELEGRLHAGDTTYPILNDEGNSIHQVNHEIIEVAHIFGAEVVDLETSRIHFWNIADYTVDGTLHPNAAGHEVIANTVINYLKANGHR